MKIWDFNGFDGIPAIYDRLSENNGDCAAADKLSEFNPLPWHPDRLTEFKNRPG
jgi:hypothetical protein